ncbi:MAG: DUF922 domain-containing protein [Chitinophagaceae bacterium]
MKFTVLSIFLCLLAAPVISPAQKAITRFSTGEEELMAWSPTRKLNWNDYKASPNPESDAAASTTTILGIDYNISSTSFSFKIQSLFSKTRSWGLHKTNYILSHEQGHFDIAEVYARMLNKEMSEYRFNKKTFQKDLQKIYEKVTKEKEETQNSYDKETRHSINREKQAEWLKRIEEMLEEYSDYADY